jgi:hypothetical protein
MTLKARLREKDRQRFFVTFLGGKMVGIVLAAAVVLGPGKFILGTTVHALAPQADVPINDIVSGTNTAWTLIAAFLAFGVLIGRATGPDSLGALAAGRAPLKLLVARAQRLIQTAFAGKRMLASFGLRAGDVATGIGRQELPLSSAG